MAAKYYNTVFEIEDSYREKKLLSLLISSLQNDMSKWTEVLLQNKTRYCSPDYNGSVFYVEIFAYVQISYILHTTPPVPDRKGELISDNFNKELKNLVENLREHIYTPEIYEIEKLVGNQHSRKEKLESLELEQLKEIVTDTYQDWLKNSSEISAKLIAKLIYSYRKNKEIYDIWIEQFNDSELIMNELKNIKG